MKAAHVYTRFGWRVVPIHDVTRGVCSCSKGAECRSSGKHPRLTAWEREASSDADTIAEWAAQWPTANVGVATGTASGFFVLDVDPDHGGDETLADIVEEHGELPHTIQAITGSGGSHYLFSLPDFPVTNRAGRSMGRGLDIRGDGGQIVVAPSRSLKGPYRWAEGHEPWTATIAPAPEWLLERLRSPRVQTPESSASPSAPSGTFPPASAAVLEEARSALDAHGPAIDGDGGGLHTVHAAALLTHDFALTDEEAWPLLVEWNDTCRPPWTLDGADSLREKLRNGRKYGKAEYGCKRTLDVVEGARKYLTEWQAVGGEPAMFEMLARVRELVRTRCDDPAKLAVIARDICTATGLKRSQVALPKVSLVVPVEEIKAGSVQVTTRLHEVADEAIKLLAPHVYQRNGVLVEVVSAERTWIHEMDVARIQDLMSRTANFVRNDEQKGLVQQQAPINVAQVLSARRVHPKGVRVLEAVTTAPVFLRDGSILDTRGYNEQARMWLEPSVSVVVDDAPTLADARQAVEVFRDLLCDFRFASAADFSSWLAGLLSPLVKAATGNAPSPLVCVSASSPGAGKTLLTEVIARVVTGAGAEVRPYNPRDPSEWGKRLTSFVKAASPVNVFDNVNGAIGDEALDRLVTASTWSDRQLGASEAPPLPIVGCWYATGNNIEPVNDTVRRVLMVRIEVDTERPQERTGFKRPLLAEYAEQHRSELLSAALTILRGYHVAGRPSQRLAAWGSFSAWSELVRGALVWAGCDDPFHTQQRASRELNEPENDAHDFWLKVVDESDGTPADIVTKANQQDAAGVLGLREPITALYLKRFVGRFVDKPRKDRRIRKDGARYFVELMS